MSELFKAGDKVTISGYYKKRSFIQWLFRKPKELQEFEIKCEVSSTGHLPSTFAANNEWATGDGWKVSAGNFNG